VTSEAINGKQDICKFWGKKEPLSGANPVENLELN